MCAKSFIVCAHLTCVRAHTRRVVGTLTTTTPHFPSPTSCSPYPPHSPVIITRSLSPLPSPHLLPHPLPPTHTPHFPPYYPPSHPPPLSPLPLFLFLLLILLLLILLPLPPTLPLPPLSRSLPPPPLPPPLPPLLIWALQQPDSVPPLDSLLSFLVRRRMSGAAPAGTVPRATLPLHKVCYRQGERGSLCSSDARTLQGKRA